MGAGADGLTARKRKKREVPGTSNKLWPKTFPLVATLLKIPAQWKTVRAPERAMAL